MAHVTLKIFLPTFKLLKPSHEKEADENQGQGRETAPLLPALKPRRGLPLLTPSPLAAHADEQKQNQAQKGQHLPQNAFSHALLRLPMDYV